MSPARLAAALLALATAACSEKSNPAPEPRSSLRVPLPDGWKASAVQGGLQVGPAGRVVLQLESTARPLPDASAFVAAVQQEDGVELMEKESVEKFVGVRYLIKGVQDRQAFLGVRQTGPRTIWCSTTASAQPEEVEAAMTVCRSLSWEG